MNCKLLLSQTEHRETWDETFDLYEQLTKDFIHALKHNDYYKLLERIEKGEKMLEEATSLAKNKQYTELLNTLYAELERHTPNEGAA